MNSMDWQDYEDGLMSAEEMKQVEQEMENSPEAAAELNGLRAFRRAVRAKGLEEPVPMRRLDAMLCDVAGRRKAGASWPRVLVPVAAGLALISAALFTAPFYLQVRAQEQVVNVHDFNEAWDEAGRIMSRPMPPIRLAGMSNASVMQVKGISRDHVCYELVMDGERYCLRMSTVQLDRSKCSEVKRDGNLYFEKDDISWSCAMTGLTYQISGGTKDGRWQLATLIHRESVQAIPSS